MKRISALLLSTLFACQQPTTTSTPEKKAAASTPSTASTSTQATSSPSEGLRWFEDDYDGALREATAQKKALFVDLWAPWCHTCISMRNYMLTQENLLEFSEKFVFVAINTERETNAPVLKKFSLEVLPTFYVVDSATEAVYGRWLGSASSDQLRSFLKDGLLAIETSKTTGGFLQILVNADRLASDKKPEEALAAYQDLLTKVPADWPRRPDVLVSTISLLARNKKFAECVDFGVQHMSNTGNAASVADFAGSAMGCADELPKTDARVEALRKAAEVRMTAVADDPKSALTPDDRSDAWRYIWEVREQLGDKAGAKAAAEKRREVLEAAMKGTPDDIAVLYDWALAETYLYLEQPDKALALVQAREKALPESYNPPNYIARVLHKTGKSAEALEALGRALKLAYGPRKSTMLGFQAEILDSLGKKDEATKVLEEQLAYAKSLPEGQRSEAKIEALEEKLKKR